MNIKQKVRIKKWQINIYIFFKSNFVRVNRLSVLVYLNQNPNSKRCNSQRIIYLNK